MAGHHGCFPIYCHREGQRGGLLNPFDRQDACGGVGVTSRLYVSGETGCRVGCGSKEIGSKGLRAERAKGQAGDVDGDIGGAGAGFRVKVDGGGPVGEGAGDVIAKLADADGQCAVVDRPVAVDGGQLPNDRIYYVSSGHSKFLISTQNSSSPPNATYIPAYQISK